MANAQANLAIMGKYFDLLYGMEMEELVEHFDMSTIARFAAVTPAHHP